MKKLVSSLVIAVLMLIIGSITYFNKLNDIETLICFGIIMFLAIIVMILHHIFGKELDKENKK